MRENYAIKMDMMSTGQNSADLKPLELSDIYDLGIEACNAKDSIKVRDIINTLKELCSDQYTGVADGITRLYDFCLQFVKDERFDKVLGILDELHQSWNMTLAANLNRSHQYGIVRVKSDRFIQK